ncbi:MAG: extracellular solute-binding protein [Eubacteriales bacterium]|nr:extracellular solute-binding protein [Eubacteriales bacterium]
MKHRRQAGAVFLAFIVALVTLIGCGGSASAKENNKKENSKKETESGDSFVFEVTASPLDGLRAEVSSSSVNSGASNNEFSMDGMDESGINYGGAYVSNGRYYVYYSDQNGAGDFRLLSFNEKGEDEKTVELPVDEDSFLMGLSISPDGRIFLAKGGYDEKTGDFSNSICGLDADGKTLWEKKIKAGEEYYVRGMASNDKATLVYSETDMRVFDNKDGAEKSVDIPVDDLYGDVCRSKDGDLLLVGINDSEMMAWSLDVDAASFKKTGMSVKGFYGTGVYTGGGTGYDLYTTKDDGVYGLSLDGSEPVKILDYIASDLMIENIQKCAAISPENVLVIYYDTEDDSSRAITLRKSDAAAAAAKTTLTLGCTFLDTDLRKAVINFNKTNSKYKIKVTEYPYEEQSDGEYQSSLNTEIAAGNVPDMLCVSSDMPIQSYASKGLFEDLEPLFSKDAEISKNEYLMNVIDAFRIDGKMYFVTPGFSMMGLMGKQKDFSDTKGVTVSLLEKLIKEKGLGYDQALGVASRDSVMMMSMYFAMNQFVDWDKGTCSFDSDAFIDLLEFAQKFPKTINYDTLDWEKMDAGMREGKQLVRDVYLTDFGTYMSERYGYIGEEVAFMGYPGNGENGPALQETISIAMSHNSVDQEGCWQFMRTLYLDDFQNSIEYTFPVSKKALKQLAEKEMNPETYKYTDENGKEVEEIIDSNSVFLNGKEIEVPVATQKDIDEVMHLLETADTPVTMDTNISNIINEETGAFFNGQKSAKETAEIIQSRVKVYISETK